jgi:hypothetical protein
MFFQNKVSKKLTIFIFTSVTHETRLALPEKSISKQILAKAAHYLCVDLI